MIPLKRHLGRAECLLDAAQAYRRLGLSVIPCDSWTKKPLVKWKLYESAPPTEDELHGWWAQWPGARIGLVTGAVSLLVVVDVDDRSADAVTEVTERLGTTGRIARTPRGGTHLYYGHPGNGRTIANAVRLLGFRFAVDVRGDGGYVLAPPSQGYRWESQGAWERLPLYPGIPDAPTPVTRRGASPQDWRELLSGVEKGRRNATLARVVGVALAMGTSPEFARMAAQEFGRRCKPPMELREVERVFTSIHSRHQRRGGLAEVEAALWAEFGHE